MPSVTPAGESSSDGQVRGSSALRILQSWWDATQVFSSQPVLEWYQEQAGLPSADVSYRKVISAVGRFGPLRLGDLARATGMTASNASKITENLVQAGLVERTVPENDRRVTLIGATEDGRALLRRLEQVDIGLLRERARSFSRDEVEIFADLIERFSEAVVDWGEQLAGSDRSPAGVTRPADPALSGEP